MAEEKDKKQEQISIELNEDIAQGQYSNLAVLTHSQTEFVIDFIALMPGAPKARVNSRVILAPQHAKRLLKALNDNIVKFESQHGEIKDIEEGPAPFPMNFGPTAEA